MTTSETYRAKGLPTRLLGSTWRDWHMEEIEDVLWHYVKSYTPSNQKIGLWAQLDVVVRKNGLEAKFGSKPRVLEVVTSSQGRTGLKRPGANAPLKHKKRMLEEYTTTERRKLARLDVGPDSSNITCTVCFEDFPSADAPVRITSTCNHDASICRGCLSASITVQLQSKIWNQISCPSCNLTLDHHDVQMFATEATFSRYDELSRREALNNDTSIRRCATPSCPYSGWCNPAIESFFICPTCTQKTCTSCETHWHTGISCEDHMKARRAAQQQEVEATEKLLDETKDFKICPNKDCAARVEKTMGCDHMRCSRCRYEYCWVCLAEYKPIRHGGNHFHATTCEHYRAFARVMPPNGPTPPVAPPGVTIPPPTTARSRPRIETGLQDPQPQGLSTPAPVSVNPIVETAGPIVPDTTQGVVREPVVEVLMPNREVERAANPVPGPVGHILARIRGLV